LLHLVQWWRFHSRAIPSFVSSLLAPAQVPRDQLHLSATLDGFVWSCMAAVGSAAGGVAVSKLGEPPLLQWNRVSPAELNRLALLQVEISIHGARQGVTGPAQCK